MKPISDFLAQLRLRPRRLLLLPVLLAGLCVLPGVLQNEIRQVVSEIDNLENRVSQLFRIP
jgi:hypothetical protein